MKGEEQFPTISGHLLALGGTTYHNRSELLKTENNVLNKALRRSQKAKQLSRNEWQPSGSQRNACFESKNLESFSTCWLFDHLICLNLQQADRLKVGDIVIKCKHDPLL